jgi:hypothetical protein
MRRHVRPAAHPRAPSPSACPQLNEIPTLTAVWCNVTMLTYSGALLIMHGTSPDSGRRETATGRGTEDKQTGRAGKIRVPSWDFCVG